MYGFNSCHGSSYILQSIDTDYQLRFASWSSFYIFRSKCADSVKHYYSLKFNLGLHKYLNKIIVLVDFACYLSIHLHSLDVAVSFLRNLTQVI